MNILRSRHETHSWSALTLPQAWGICVEMCTPSCSPDEHRRTKVLNVPVSHKTGELGIAVASQQLDAVSSHGEGF